MANLGRTADKVLGPMAQFSPLAIVGSMFDKNKKKPVAAKPAPIAAGGFAGSNVGGFASPLINRITR